MLRAVEGVGFPSDVLGLLRDALALGFASHLTQIVRSEVGGCDWMAEVVGDLPIDLAARARLRGFRRRRTSGRKFYAWCSIPDDPKVARERRRERPPAAPPAAPPEGPLRGPRRELPEGCA